VIAARIHPGIAVLVVVAGITATLLILQSVDHRSSVTASAPATVVVQSAPPAVQLLPPVARTLPTQQLSGIAGIIDADTIEVRGNAHKMVSTLPNQSKHVRQPVRLTRAASKRPKALIIFLGAHPVERTEKGRIAISASLRNVGSIPLT
jgi:hypothetical protein